MPETLSLLRRAKGLSQEKLGALVAARLGQDVGSGYAQKKVSRIESGETTPTTEELRAIAEVLGVDEEIVAILIDPTRRSEATSRFEDLARSDIQRSLMAVCCLSRARPHVLDQSLETARRAFEQG